MGRQYFKKKDPTAQIPEWIEMSGQEFYCFVRSHEGRGRYFIDFDDYVIEASKDQYEDWRKERDHSNYLRVQETGIILLSLYSDTINEYGDGEDVIADDSVDVEGSALVSAQVKSLYAALKQLDLLGYRLIHELYLADKRKTERGLAREWGVSQNAVHKQKKKVLEKLKMKMSVVKSPKSSQ